MDTSETFIKMRLAARKDLLDGIPPECNWDNPKWITNNVFVDVKGDFYYSNEKISCQLERQDQLQEMIQGSTLCKLLSIATFADSQYRMYPNDPNEGDWYSNYEPQGLSREQLELSFVMKKKYNRVWNGEDWVKS